MDCSPGSGSCIQCEALGCGWCASSQQCLPGGPNTPDPPHTCYNNWYYAKQCPDPDTTFPIVGYVAIILMSFTLLMVALRLLLYLCRKSEPIRPIIGFNLAESRCYSIQPLILIVMSLALKLPAIVYNRFDQDGNTYFGLLSIYFDNGNNSLTQSWSTFCTIWDASNGNDSTNYQLCQIEGIAGTAAMVMLIPSIAASSFAFLLGLVVIIQPDRFPLLLSHLWRFTGLAHMFTLATNLLWLSVHIILQWQDSDTRLWVSFIFICLSWAFDFLSLIYYRRASRITPPHDGALLPPHIYFDQVAGHPGRDGYAALVDALGGGGPIQSPGAAPVSPPLYGSVPNRLPVYEPPPLKPAAQLRYPAEGGRIHEEMAYQYHYESRPEGAP